jgi:hypothetical protein
MADEIIQLPGNQPQPEEPGPKKEIRVRYTRTGYLTITAEDGQDASRILDLLNDWGAYYVLDDDPFGYIRLPEDQGSTVIAHTQFEVEDEAFEEADEEK